MTTAAPDTTAAPPAARTAVNSATGIMGKTGTGKSALLATLAEYVWKRYRKVTLYYNSDGGGFPAKIQQMQHLGIMRVFRMRTRDPGDLGLAFETAYRCYQGWWPKTINPSTGEVPPGVEMVPPVALRYQVYCPEGHLVRDVPGEHLATVAGVCPGCRKPVNVANMRIEKALIRNKGFEDVGAVCFDGLTSVLAWELMEMGHRAGRMELKGEEAAIGGKVVSGQLKFGGVTRSHVGFAQSRGEELVHLTLGIPNLVVPPVITMLTHEDVDDRGLNITGPKVAGRAKTDEAPQWMGNLLESDVVPALDGTSQGTQRILYLKEFTEQSITGNRRHLCKIRGNPGTMPAYLADPVGGEDDPSKAFTQFNLGVFFEKLDAALTASIEEAQQLYPDAPGLVSGWVEFGDSSIVTPQPAAAGPAGVSTGPQTLGGGTAGGTGTSAPPAAAPAPRGRKRTAGATTPATPPPATEEAPPATTEAPAPPPVQTTEPTAPETPPVATTPAPTVPAAPAVPAATPAAPVQTAAPAPAAPRPAGPAAPAGVRPAVAPPAGVRPPAASPRPAVTPAAAPAAAPAPAGVQPPMTASGPGIPRPAAAVPRPPAAAPRPAPAPRAPGTPGPPDGHH